MLASWSASEITQSQTAESLPAVQETRVLVPGSGRSPGEANCNPLRYTCLENPMDGGAWQAAVHEVAKSHTTKQLSFPKVGSRYVIIQVFWRISDPAMEDEYTDLREEIP